MFYHLTLQTQGVPSPRNAARSVRSRYLGGQPVFNLASPSHKVELRKGFVLWVLVFPRPYNTKTKKNSKNKAHIFWDQTLSPKLSDHSIVVHCLTTPMHCAVLCLVTQSCPPLWDPIDCSPPGSFVHGNSPGKNKVAMSSSRGSSQPRVRTQVSHIAGGFFTIWAHEYWSGYPIPSSGDLPDSGIKLGSFALQADSLPP